MRYPRWSKRNAALMGVVILVCVLGVRLFLGRVILAEITPEPGQDSLLCLSCEDARSSVTLNLIWQEDQGLWFGETEITFAQFSAIAPDVYIGWNERERRLYWRDSWPGISEDWPAMNISPWQIEQFLDALNDKVRVLPYGAYVFRLPTRTEWEKAATTSDAGKYYWGADWPPPRMTDGRLPNIYGENSVSGVNAIPPDRWQHREWYVLGYEDGFPLLAPVMQSGRNRNGLLGMIGNQKEWCHDPLMYDYFLKGGSFFDSRDEHFHKGYSSTIAANRPWPFLPFVKDKRSGYSTGFRIVLAPRR